MRLLGLFLLTSFMLVNICFAEIPIYCPHCKVHLYNYQKDEVKIGDDLKAEDFKPASEDIQQPQENTEMICPLCMCPLNLYESWAWERKMKKPVFHTWAISFLTKDKDENWVGYPYDVIFEDWEGKY